ncbi:molybdate transport system ATP-binding protein [Motilibacter rhizosphaerae]|uniref:Molybdate transport system ATP-binding protein n=1 Tax=Motilibacter rhizosphaerae TaxID=598652 RepID=A0A4Q7NVQ4_9ACTN|nr:ABC transporter ATP-binding protein [Motilibacter rhizosphaerae]RZS90958.1 molybdate transport system ATP-binding protein [Motilibacter rhizosphaerae]
MKGLAAKVSAERGEFRLDVDLSVAPGEVLAVLGPNGAGKTTLLRTLCGLDPLRAGRIELRGRLLDDGRTSLAPEHRRVGVVFQDYRLFPHLSVRDNVAFGRRSSGSSRHEAAHSAQHWLERLGIADLADRRPGALSGGQAQRVALARALAGAPDLLLLDEPLAALDAETRHGVRGQLAAHLRDPARPALLVTHDPLEAMVLGDRLLVLEGGRATQTGRPAEVARRPATAYVARLLGLNLYAGTVTADGVELDGGGVLHAAGSPDPGTPALVALRPSSVTVSTERPSGTSTRNVWPAVVAGMELLHDRVRLSAEGAPSALVDLTPGAVAELGLRPGAEVWLSAKATEVEAYPRG